MAAPTVRGKSVDDGEDDGPARYCLLVLGPDHTETRELPERGILSIGRDEDADVRVVDGLVSRAHARLHVGGGLAIEDLGSANGTRLRDQPVPAHIPTPLAPGDAVAIGSTVLVVQRGAPPYRARRLRPHGYFEARLIEACAQAERARGGLAVVRLHIAGNPAADPATAEETVVATLRPGDLLASYGPGEYEVLLVDTSQQAAEALTAGLVGALREQGLDARAGIAHFPGDGTSPQALVGRACQRVLGPAPSATADAAPEPPGIVLENPAMRQLYALAERAAPGTINVLITGETGVGKEILAQRVHQASPRASGPFVCLNCAALSDALIESELFGHEKGAFTGALQTREGLFETASSGTLFLDEIGEMSLGMQAKVLRAIETRQVLRVGARRPRPVDVRFIAASNRDLEEEIAAKRFREDLYFRLNGITLAVPPLRERLDEIPALVQLFLEAAARPLGQSPPRVAAETMAELRAYTWPGNVRELRNAVERALLLSAGGTITPEHLPLERMRRAPATGAAAGGRSLEEIEKQAIIDSLIRCHGNQTRAAELLGMPRRTFCKRLAEYGITRPRA
jgi:two-component system response regulator AtoC